MGQMVVPAGRNEIVDPSSDNLDIVDERHPWDRLPNEPSIWFYRFDRYRLLGPERTMARAYTIYRRERRMRAGKPVDMGRRWSAPPPWWQNWRLWRWKERAEAWDEYQCHLDERVVAIRRVRIREMEWMASEKLQRVALSILDRSPEEFTSMQVSEAVGMLRAASELGRSSIGDDGSSRDESDRVVVAVVGGFDIKNYMGEREEVVSAKGDDSGDGDKV